MTKILIKDIIIPYTSDIAEAERLAMGRLKGLIGAEDIKTSLYRRSVDARKKYGGNEIRFVCSVLAEIPVPSEKLDIDILKRAGAEIYDGAPLAPPEFGEVKLGGRPVVAGFGPCGMFCAMLLAEYGYRPIVFERGSEANERAKIVERFRRERILDTECNIQFGAGGAGAFSDGKLVTRISDGRCRFVLERLRLLGAPKEILTEARPHIGTDRLLPVIANADEYIRRRGGAIFYNTDVKGLIYRGGLAVGALTDKGEVGCGAVILAVGHSARDTYKMLLSGGFDIIPKPFSVGVRIEHLQSEIDAALYGAAAGDPRIGKAEYNLSDKFEGRGVYTFCMCPGGEVVAAASEEGGVVTNGMSRYLRDGKNANSAVAVSVGGDGSGFDAMGAVEFQRKLERTAFTLGGGDYTAPVQTVDDFLAGKTGSEPSKVSPTYMGGRVKTASLDAALPPDICRMLRLGIMSFDKKIKGFAAPYAVLTGVESRTSAPVRILRGADFTAPRCRNVYPAGEGAGYSGGITSSAVDGVACAYEFMRKYSPYDI